MGIEDILFNGAVLIEWADKIKNRFDYNTLELEIEGLDLSRTIRIKNIHGWGDRMKELKIGLNND